MDAAKDTRQLIFMTMIFHGLGTLTAWNMFITAKDYFVKYKLANAPFYSSNFLVYIGYASQLPNFFFSWFNVFVTIAIQGSHLLHDHVHWNMFITVKDYFVKYKLANAPFYSSNFIVYIGYASQLPNFFFSWFNVFVTIAGNLSTRIIWSLVFEVLIFLVTVILAMVDSTSWTRAFFWITIVCVFFLNAFNAIFQNSVFGVAARLPQRYTGALVLGSNVCGTLVVLLHWMTDLFGSSLRVSAIYYFIAGMFVLMLCIDSYLALPLNKFYRHFAEEAKPARATTGHPARTPYLDILKTIWVQLYNVFIVFFVSLGIFPAVLSDIAPVTPGFLGDNFMRITCFLTFNLTALIGCITASFWQIPSRRWLAVFTTLRILFIPFFLLCNYHPLGRIRTAAVVVKSDALYWIVTMLLGWSSGHGSALGMMYVGGNVAPQYAPKAGMLGGATLITGILAGITFSGVCPSFVSEKA